MTRIAGQTEYCHGTGSSVRSGEPQAAGHTSRKRENSREALDPAFPSVVLSKFPDTQRGSPRLNGTRVLGGDPPHM